MDTILTGQYRTHVNMVYRDYLIATLGYKLPVVSSGGQLIELAKRCMNPPIEAEHGWRSDPPFPGALETPEKTPNGWRMICASRLYHEDREFGVIFVTLYGGRAVTAFVNGPGSWIPDYYTPITAL